MLKNPSVWFAIFILTCILTACGGLEVDQRQSTERNWQEEELTCKALDVDPQAPGGPAVRTEPGDDIKQDEDLQRYLRQVTVQIQGPIYLGSGVVWDAYEEALVIATAAHVAQDNSPMTVQFGQGDPVEARLIYVSDQVDVAFLEVSLQELEARG